MFLKYYYKFHNIYKSAVAVAHLSNWVRVANDANKKKLIMPFIRKCYQKSRDTHLHACILQIFMELNLINYLVSTYLAEVFKNIKQVVNQIFLFN